MYSRAELYAAILRPPGEIENPKASPCGNPAELEAAVETIFSIVTRGRLGSSSRADCQLYLTRSFFCVIWVVL